MWQIKLANHLVKLSWWHHLATLSWRTHLTKVNSYAGQMAFISNGIMKWFAATLGIGELTGWPRWACASRYLGCQAQIAAGCDAESPSYEEGEGSDQEARSFSGRTYQLQSRSFLHDTSFVGWGSGLYNWRFYCGCFKGVLFIGMVGKRTE